MMNHLIDFDQDLNNVNSLMNKKHRIQ
jgi:hypothetical protein